MKFNNEKVLLAHIKKEKNLGTGLTWDNFGINIQALSDKNTDGMSDGIFSLKLNPRFNGKIIIYCPSSIVLQSEESPAFGNLFIPFG